MTKEFPSTARRFQRVDGSQSIAKRDALYVDAKGRRIGGIVRIWAEEVVEYETDEYQRRSFERWGHMPSTVEEPVGAVRWSLRFQASRNGEAFGSSNPERNFATLDEAVAFSRGWLDGVNARATRVAGARPAPANDPVG